MARGVFMRSMTAAPLQGWKRLADTPTVVRATIVASSANTSPINMRIDGGPAAAWPPGTTITLDGVDLYRFEFSATTTSHAVLVVGHTR